MNEQWGRFLSCPILPLAQPFCPVHALNILEATCPGKVKLYASKTDPQQARIPQSKRAAGIGKQLMKLAKKRDRSIKHLVVEAILDYLDREEQ